MQVRKEKLLQLVVESYLDTAEPVSSKFLAEFSDLKLSGATLRNEMRELEDSGFLTHPHTSSGRIPTEAGYRYYIKNIMKAVSPKKNIKNKIDSAAKSDQDQFLKTIAKQVAQYVGGAVIVAEHKDSIYYTGISNLFAQPEFRDYSHAVSVSTIFDQCEDYFDDLYDMVEENKIEALVGKKNPFGSACGVVVVRVGQRGLFAILGPIRMNYEESIGVLNYILQII